MKRVFALFLTLALCLGLCACTVGDNTTPTAETNPTEATNATKFTDAATEPSTEPAIEPTTETTTEPTTETTTEPTTIPTTEPTTETTTEPTTIPTTEPTSETTEPPHTHSFNAATCTTPRTCSCGTTEGSATGHSWKDATCTAPKTCSICSATEGTPSEHTFYAGECKICKTEDSAMKRIYAAENLFSFVLPSSWKSYEIYGNEFVDGPFGKSFYLTIQSTKFCHDNEALPVFVFQALEHGKTFFNHLGDDGRIAYQYVSTNGMYDIYFQYVLDSGITEPGDKIIAGATDADLQELRQIVAKKDEILSSFRWE